MQNTTRATSRSWLLQLWLLGNCCTAAMLGWLVPGACSLIIHITSALCVHALLPSRGGKRGDAAMMRDAEAHQRDPNAARDRLGSSQGRLELKGGGGYAGTPVHHHHHQYLHPFSVYSYCYTLSADSCPLHDFSASWTQHEPHVCCAPCRCDGYGWQCWAEGACSRPWGPRPGAAAQRSAAGR
jgi:hypothetical protein